MKKKMLLALPWLLLACLMLLVNRPEPRLAYDTDAPVGHAVGQ